MTAVQKLDRFVDFCTVDLGLARVTALQYRAKVRRLPEAVGPEVTPESIRKSLRSVDRGHANNYIKAAKAHHDFKTGNVAEGKSAIAASLGALRLLGKGVKYNVLMAASPDEEIGGVWGIGYLMRDVRLKMDCGVVVDSMPNMVGIGACGRMTGEIKVFGKQGHAGYNYLADNPIPKLARLLVELEGFVKQREQKLSAIDAPPMSPKKKLWGRISFTVIGGGEKENVVPALAWTRFDLRLLPDEEPLEAKSEFLDYFERAKERLGMNAALTFDYEDPGFVTAASTPFVRAFSEAASAVFGQPLPIAASLGGDDGKFLSERGIPVVSYGAIADDTQFHGTDEFVHLSDLEHLRDVLVKLIG